MNELDRKYLEIYEESKNNPNIVGLMLEGARGKSDEFLTENSDIDLAVIVTNDASQELIEKLKSYRTTDFEISVYTVDEFKEHAAWGGKLEWNRYNFTRNKAVIDKTGAIQKIINEKGVLPKEVQRDVVESALDDYINQLYRSAKYTRDGNLTAAYLDATESLPPLMTALYALEGRIKPYNKYFEWELKKHPLELLPWPVDEFIANYLHILKTGDIETQKKIYLGIKKLFLEQGYSESINGWKSYYFVGK